jgi:hypothetical protein
MTDAPTSDSKGLPDVPRRASADYPCLQCGEPGHGCYFDLFDEAWRCLKGKGEPSKGTLQPDEAADTAEPVKQAGVRMTKLADVQPVSIRWLWPHRIALGKLTLIAGDRGWVSHS